MKHYLIYEIKNKLNGMIYVGKHVTNDINDSYMGSGLKIRRAIEKYGIENFEKTILFECSSEEEMNKKEAEIVNENFIARDDVYNVMLGGDGGWNTVNKNPNNTGSKHFFKNKTKAEISEIGRRGGMATSMRIKNMSAEERQHLHEERSRIAKMGWSTQFLGKHHTIESKKKMSDTKHKNMSSVGKKNSQYGTMWICNDKTHESKKMLKTEMIPSGWRKGRFCK